MNCEHLADNISGLVASTLSPAQAAECRQHLAGCPACREALRGAEALAMLRARGTGEVPPGLFATVMQRLDAGRDSRRSGQSFWLGSLFGGALAASLFFAALVLGWIGVPNVHAPETAELHVALGEVRNMDLAIETDRAMRGATVSVLLAGGVELQGYGQRRELTWTSDLEKGINRLSLPVIAIGEQGGSVIVRLSHPQSEQVFVVRLKNNA
jgi:anti-sigma factor RsiW